MFGWLRKITPGRNWKGVTGGALLALSGAAKLVALFAPDWAAAINGALDGVATVAAGLGIVGIRGAQGKR